MTDLKALRELLRTGNYCEDDLFPVIAELEAARAELNRCDNFAEVLVSAATEKGRSAALEECARIADAEAQAWSTLAANGFDAGCEAASLEIAKAIRALVPR